ncbi:MAG: type II secretion system F family protein [Candidatus Moranbacteria bacterium]|nr:type II secretion system F family protein [Candidatus Moranbacteria bacterium]
MKEKKENKKIEKSKRHGFWVRLSVGSEKDYFVESLSMLISSGMNVVSALEVIKREVRSKIMKKVINEFQGDIEAGVPLWDSMNRSGIFSEYVISLVRVGEKIGGLPENLILISNNQQKENIFKSRMRSAAMYPMIVFLLGFVIATGIAWFILPRLATVFAQLDIQLPWATKILISFGEFLGEYGNVFIPSFLIFVIIVFFFVFVFKKTRHVGQAIILSLPGIRRLMQEMELSRFGFILGSVLEAGLTIVDSLESLSRSTTIRRYQKLYVFLRKNVEEGESFQQIFEKYPKSEKLIPASIQQMIITGEQSGNLPEVLQKIGRIFEDKTEITTKNLTVILEPVLLVIVWLGVIFVALAIILPIYSLIGGLS